MTCYHPSNVGISRKSFARPGARVSDRVTVPCGSCLGCRTDQARGWAVRLVHEGDVAGPAWFATLTYAPEKCPDNGTLVPRDVTLFLKRLRLSESGRVSYYLSGEYGDATQRPHYHMVLFGAALLDREFLTHRSGAAVYRSAGMEEHWGAGLCEFTGLNYAAARYVASYVRKKVRQRDNPNHYTRVDPATGELVDIAREFGRMSRRPAIGRRWIERFWKDVYPRDFVVMEGRPLKPPRYYDKWMEAKHPEIMLAVKEQRLADIREIGHEELIMKEKCHRARVDFFQGRDGV